ncbi:MAG: hypothetical protein OXC95_03965 [Dehalococcoidia bacterium]|nr:hypothetical protein [Dehalococcoidia bacterium]
MIDVHLSDTSDTYMDSSIGSATSVVTMSEESHNPKSADLADLNAALEDLDGVIDEAREDGYTEPTPQAIDNARLLVKAMYDIRPMRYDIYPMDEGEVVIDGGSERRIGVFCYPDRSVLYIGWADGERVRIRRDDSKDIPHEFLTLALRQLGDD